MVPVTRSVLIACCVNNVSRYHKACAAILPGQGHRGCLASAAVTQACPPLHRAAWRKLAMLDAAEVLADLRVPPGNRLEKLAGDRAGQYSRAGRRRDHRLPLGREGAWRRTR